MLCILYVNAIGALFGIVGSLIERVLPATSARRWVWCLIIALSLFVPGYYRAHHAAPVGGAPGGTSPLALDQRFWARVDALDPSISRAWFIGSALLIVWTLANAGWVSRQVLLARSGRRGTGGPAVVDGVPVVVTESLGPATVGVLRTDVLLPRWVLALPGAQRRYVVRHEDEHRRSHDGHLLFFASLLLIVVPWNVALWWQLRRLSLAVEMDCDNRVVRALGDAPVYGDLLLKIALAANRGPRLQPALLGGFGALERRLTALMTPVSLRPAHRLMLSAAVAALLVFGLSMPHPVIAKSHAHPSTTAQAERSGE